MNKEKLAEIIAENSISTEIESKELPPIDLYIDQILSLVNSKLGDNATKHGERLLTKTMINNYSKDGIVKSINGKKYTKEHIIQMLLVYSLKNTISISEIKRLMFGVYEQKKFDGETLNRAYDKFVEKKKQSINKYQEHIDFISNEMGLDIENEEDYLTLILYVCSVSSTFKYIAQGMIENGYIDKDTFEKEMSKKNKDKKDEKKDKNKSSKKEKTKNEK